MLKKITFFIAVLLVPAILFAAEGTIGKDHWTYKDIKSLVDTGVISKPLVKESLTREDVVEYINDGVHNMLAANKPSASSSSDAELMSQIDKLYNLVKAYMTDMMKTQQKLDSILETIGDLKVKKEMIEKKQDRLLNAMGMRINGESSAYMTDVLLFGNLYQFSGMPAQRYRPITQYLDLKFSLNATKELYSEATFRIENLYGGFWGSGDIYGLRRFFIEGKYPLSFVLGDFQGKMTPFTLWAVDDERAFEAKLFSDKRDMNKRELYLIDNTWPLSGGKLQTVIEIVDTVDINIMALGARLGQNGKFNYKAYDPLSNLYMPALNNHDQYLYGFRVDSGLGIPDYIDIGFNMSDIIDSKDTGTYAKPALDNAVYSVDAMAQYKLAEGMEAKVNGEYAMSKYTNFMGRNPYVSDSAMNAGLEVTGFNTTLSVGYLNVGNSFTAYASQTRMYDEGANPLYLTQNSTWNIATSPPSYSIGARVYPFTRYNPTINVAYGNSLSAYSGLSNNIGNLLFYPQYENNISPYGDSTPNRNKIAIKLEGDYDLASLGIPLTLKPAAGYQMAHELIGYTGIDTMLNIQTIAPRNYTVIEGGLRAEWNILALNMGYRMEDTQNNSHVAYSSAIIDAGLECTIIKKKLVAYAGYKNIAFNGYEYFVRSGFYSLPTEKIDQSVTSMGAGVEYRIAKPAVMGLSFTNTKIDDLNDVRNSFSAQELDIKVSISF